jgi:hypothetical protein
MEAAANPSLLLNLTSIWFMSQIHRHSDTGTYQSSDFQLLATNKDGDAQPANQSG